MRSRTQTLYDGDHAVLSGLAQVWKRVGELAAIEPQFAEQLDARESIKSQLEDMALLLRRYADDIDASPERLQQVEDRLALIERLKRKYGPTLEDVIATGASLARERELLTRSEEAAEDLERALDEARAAIPEPGARALESASSSVEDLCVAGRGASGATGHGADEI